MKGFKLILVTYTINKLFTAISTYIITKRVPEYNSTKISREIQLEVENYPNKTFCYCIFGIRRSGLHFICTDIMHNYYKSNQKQLLFINDPMRNDKYALNKIPKHRKMFLFEETFDLINVKQVSNQINVLIIRDIYDVIISRTKKSYNEGDKWWAEINPKYL